MKIFNWVHRRFTHDHIGEFISENVKKGECKIVTKESETKTLLDNVVLADFLADGWKGGLLSIGTLGLQTSFDNFKEENETTFEEYDEDSVEDECEFDHDLVDQVNQEEQSGGGESNPLMRSGSIRSSNFDEIASDIVTFQGDHDDDDDDDCTMKKKRVTLAELFSAESDEGNYNYNTSKKGTVKPNWLMIGKKKPNADQAIKLGSKKKLIPADGVKDDSRPLKKLHHLMRRMLKRKIHPVAAEAKISTHKDLYRTKSSRSTVSIPSDQLGDSDSVSLLQIPDVVCVE